MGIYDYQGNQISAGMGIVSVADYGAKGNGTADDTTAIQSALTALSSTGGIIFFPKGTYKITASVVFYSNQTLWFENGATLLQGAAINNLLMSYCGSSVTAYNGTHDCLIYGATFDGGAYTTNNTLAGTVHAKNIVFDRCTFKNAYGTWHDLEINSSYNCKVLNCDFEGARKTGVNGCMIQIDPLDNEATWPWSDNRGSVDNTIAKYIEIAGCTFHDSTYVPGIGNHGGASDCFSFHDNLFVNLTSSRGAINFDASNNIDIYSNIFEGCTTGVGSGNNTYYVHDNRFIGVTTAVNSNCISHANMINGTYTA